MTVSRILAAAAVAAAFATASVPATAQGDAKVLRIVPHSNLSILDPIWTTQYMARNHGYMIYDTLFGTDENSQVKPQMVDTWSVSADKKVWDFRLRSGLAFHDGKPVTGEDVVASLNRWGKRDAMGVALMGFIEKLEATGAGSIRMTLKEPCGFVLEALGKPSSNVPFIMQKRIAETDAFKQIEEHIGSGPYMFVREEFKPGDKAVYVRNPKYVPRKEAPSGSAGGKQVFVERVEWNLALRDAQAQVNALVKGEIDILEQPSFPLIPGLKANADIVVYSYSPVFLQFMARFNHLHKPFDNAKVRQAALAAFSQEPFLQAQVGVKELYRTCASMFTCGTPYASPAGSDIQSKSNMKKAQELLKASGYDGTVVVLMKPTDLAAIDKLPDVAAQLMRQAGFKVDLQAMDWNTLVGRRAKKDAPDKGGWNMFLTAWQGPDIWNPIVNPTLDTRGEASGWFGWGKDEKIPELKALFMRETDDGKRKKLAEAIQTRAFEVATHAPLGEFDAPLAARKNITGHFRGTGNFYWNVRKN